MKNVPDVILNLLIFLVTAGFVLCFPRKDGEWKPERWKKAFRFFTCQSNVLCAAACLLTTVAAAAGEIPEWIWLLKYIGTAAVTVTMVTVFLFLAPSVGKDWAKVLLTGRMSDLFMHLITPVMALISFCIFEKRGMTFVQALAGLLPVVLYGGLYLYKIRYAPVEKRWEDFYGFSRGGKVALSFAGMVAGTFLICMVLMALQNA